MTDTSREALIKAIKHELAEFAHNKVLETLLLDSVDMLEADAQDAFTVGLACQSKQAQQVAVPVAVLDAISRAGLLLVKTQSGYTLIPTSRIEAQGAEA